MNCTARLLQTDYLDRIYIIFNSDRAVQTACGKSKGAESGADKGPPFDESVQQQIRPV